MEKIYLSSHPSHTMVSRRGSELCVACGVSLQTGNLNSVCPSDPTKYVFEPHTLTEAPFNKGTSFECSCGDFEIWYGDCSTYPYELIFNLYRDHLRKVWGC